MDVRFDPLAVASGLDKARPVVFCGEDGMALMRDLLELAVGAHGTVGRWADISCPHSQ